MAPKKKQKVLPPQARFAALKVVVIDALPFQRKLWQERIGAGFVAVTSPEVLAGALARHEDATHVVSCARTARSRAAFYKWQRDPARRAVFEINALKMHVGKKRAVDLVANRGVTSAAELCARRDDPALAIPEHIRANLALAPVGPSATRMDREETEAILRLRRRRRRSASRAPLVAVADYEFHDADGAGFRLLERFFARLAAVDVGGAPFLHPHQNMGSFLGAKEAPKLGIRHCFVRSPAVPGAFRQVDFFLCPTEIIAHGLLGYSGRRPLPVAPRLRQPRARERWAEVPDGRPIVGHRGWNVSRDGTRVGSLIEGRELQDGEHWAWSQNGITIAMGKSGNEDCETTYEECNINLRTEADAFAFPPRLPRASTRA
ncbi:hypothetical protein JL720_6760 [Aureococcus anophagefferens]|nr:hypothetical protein JL720_6760 [Aureococcus anophagefferens]